MSAALKVISAAIADGVYLKLIPERIRTSLGRTGLIALAIYIVVLAAFIAMVPRDRLWSHSPYNHYSLQADAWLAGRLDLPGPPPRYTGNNDFALVDGKYFVSFPPVPALLMMPFRVVAGRVERVRDPLIFATLAPLAPALLFLTLERLRRLGRTVRKEAENALLATSFALGTVYWFSAVQGSVWFGGHVVTTVLLCAFLLASIEARHPIVAGLALALAFGTRPTAALALPVFVAELWRVRDQVSWRTTLAAFAVPSAAVVSALMWHNAARFGDPTEFGHAFLAIRWQERIDAHGLFSLHFLPRNASVFFRGLPFWGANGLQINGHGLALWFTTPIFVWALWPRERDVLYRALAGSALAITLTVLCYQNSGWLQFGYRFSNDFAPLLFVMIALAGRRLNRPFWLLAAFGLVVNGFGALTFDRADHAHLYFVDPTQEILHAPP